MKTTSKKEDNLKDEDNRKNEDDLKTGGLSRYLFLCLTSLVSYIVSYLLLTTLAPFNCWQNVIPKLYKASFCALKIEHFRVQAIVHLVLLWQCLPEIFQSYKGEELYLYGKMFV